MAFIKEEDLYTLLPKNTVGNMKENQGVNVIEELSLQQEAYLTSCFTDTYDMRKELSKEDKKAGDPDNEIDPLTGGLYRDALLKKIMISLVGYHLKLIHSHNVLKENDLTYVMYQETLEIINKIKDGKLEPTWAKRDEDGDGVADSNSAGVYFSFDKDTPYPGAGSE